MAEGSWVGLDVHARSVIAGVLDAGSGELRSWRAPTLCEETVVWLGQFPGPVGWPSSTAALEPYLPEGTRYPYFGGEAKPHPQGYFREDTVSPRGGLPASDPEFVVEHLLDRHGIDYAILSCGSTLGIGNLPDIDVAADVGSATNDWTIDEWFPV